MNLPHALARHRILFQAGPGKHAAAAALIALAGVQAACHLLADGHDAQRLLQSGFLLMVGLWMLAAGKTGLLAPTSAPGKALAAIFMLGLVSAALSFSPRHAVWEVINFFMLLALGACVATEVARDADRCIRIGLTVIGATCLAYIGKVLPAYAAALATSIPPTPLTFTPGFDNYRFLNHAQTVSLPLLVLLAVSSPPGGRLRKAWFATAAGWWALLFFTAGRGTLIGVVAGCAVALLVMRQSAFAFCKGVLATAIAGLAAYLLFFAAIPLLVGMEPFGLMANVAERSVARPTSGRIELWITALDLARSHPLLGAGPAHFAHYGTASVIVAHPHNWVLQVASEWGLPALALLLFVIGYAIKRLVQVRHKLAATDSTGRTVLSAFLATAAAILVDSLVSGVIVMPVSQLLVTLFAGMAAGWTLAHSEPRAPTAPVSWRRPACGIVVIAAIAGLAWSLAPDLSKAVGGGERVKRSDYSPRMWEDGIF